MPSWDHKLLIIRAEDEEHWPFLCLLVTSLYTPQLYTGDTCLNIHQQGAKRYPQLALFEDL